MFRKVVGVRLKMLLCMLVLLLRLMLMFVNSLS